MHRLQPAGGNPGECIFAAQWHDNNGNRCQQDQRGNWSLEHSEEDCVNNEKWRMHEITGYLFAAKNRLSVSRFLMNV